MWKLYGSACNWGAGKKVQLKVAIKDTLLHPSRTMEIGTLNTIERSVANYLTYFKGENMRWDGINIFIAIVTTLIILMMLCAVVHAALAENKLSYKDLGNGQICVNIEWGDEEFLFEELAKKYGSKYKIISTNTGKYGNIYSVIIEVQG